MFSRHLLNVLFLFALIVLTYFFVEKPEYEKYLEKTKSSYFLRSLKIRQIKTKGFHLVQNDNLWNLVDDKNFKIDQGVVNSFIKRLKKLKIIKKVNLENINHSWECFYIFDNEKKIEIQVGEKQKYSGRYYIKLKNKDLYQYFLVEDMSPQKEAIPDEIFRVNPLKRLKILEFVKRQKVDLTHRSINIEGAQTVIVDRSLGRKFTIDLEKNDIFFLSGKNFRIDEDSIISWKKNISSLISKKIFFINNDIKNMRELGAIVLVRGNHHEKYKVFIKEDFAYVENSTIVRRYPIKQIDMLLPSYQKFIDRKYFNLEEEKKSDFNFSLNDKKIRVSFRNDLMRLVSDDISKKNLNHVGEFLKILFEDASYLNWGNEMTIIPEKKILLRVSENKIVEIGRAHGVVEIFDKSRGLSYFFRNPEIYSRMDSI